MATALLSQALSVQDKHKAAVQNDKKNDATAETASSRKTVAPNENCENKYGKACLGHVKQPIEPTHFQKSIAYSGTRQ